jgi:hypothetical protein
LVIIESGVLTQLFFFKAVWNKWYMERKASFNLSWMWADSETDITSKVTRSYEASDNDLRRAASPQNCLF